MYYLLHVTFCSDSERAHNKNDHLEQLTQRFYLTRSTQSMSRLFTITQYISTHTQDVKNHIKCKKYEYSLFLTKLHADFSHHLYIFKTWYAYMHFKYLFLFLYIYIAP